MGINYTNGMARYLPSPETIRRECEKIRESWTEEEEAKRAGAGIDSKPYELPSVRGFTSSGLIRRLGKEGSNNG